MNTDAAVSSSKDDRVGADGRPSSPEGSILMAGLLSQPHDQCMTDGSVNVVPISNT